MDTDRDYDDKPVWLLDVDGVVNALGANAMYRQAWRDSKWITGKLSSKPGGQEYRFCTAQPVVDFIRAVHEQGLVEIRWHTTWQQGARRVEEFLGLPELGIQEAPEYKTTSLGDGWWKLPAAWRVVHEGRRVIWTDDDFDIELKDSQFQALEAAGASLLRPNSRYGLTGEDLQQILVWLTGDVPHYEGPFIL